MKTLEINNSPTKLSKNNKRLSKAPIAIAAIILIVFLFGLAYAVSARQANLNKKAEATQTLSEQNDKEFKDQDIIVDELISASELKEKIAKNSKLDQKEPTSQQAELAPAIIMPKTPINNEKQQELSEFEQKELALKEEMRLKALTSITKLGIESEYEKDKQGKNEKDEDDKNYIKRSMDEYYNSLAQTAQQAIGLTQFENSNKFDKDEEAQKFLSKKSDEIYLEQPKLKPLSKYEIKAGWIIPATLITGINSDLTGQIVAQISQNVYDSATGKYLLIPQGTKAVGFYSSNVLYGQSRVLVAWSRLIFPNGDSISLENMQGISPDGYSGFSDQVDNHYFRIFGSAFLMSAITAGISLADKSDPNAQKETARDKAIAAAIHQMGTVAAQIIQKNLNISPTIKIRPGYKFNIFVSKDIILEPLRSKR